MACTCALLLAGCVAYEPRPLVPLDELAALRTRELPGLQVERATPGDAEPRTRAFDPSDGLDEAEVVAVALTLNPRLRAKRMEIGEARALLVTAGLWPDPELDLAVRPELSGGAATGTDLDLLFELLRPGERSARQAVAEARVDAVRAEVVADEYRLAAETRKSYLAVLAGEQAARLLEQEAELRERAVALVQQRQDFGDATALDVVLLQLERAEVQRELRAVEADNQAERRVLLALLGLPPAYELRLSDSGRELSFALYSDLTEDELDARLLAGRFDLKAADERYRAAEQELRLAVVRQYPSLRIGPSFEGDGSEQTLGLAASLGLPVFDRNRGDIAAKDAARERARAEYVALLHELRARAFAARAALDRARAEVELQTRELMPVVEQSEALFEGALRARELTIFEWLTARNRALQARSGFLQALTLYTNAVIDLEAATGSKLSERGAAEQPLPERP